MTGELDGTTPIAVGKGTLYFLAPEGAATTLEEGRMRPSGRTSSGMCRPARSLAPFSPRGTAATQ